MMKLSTMQEIVSTVSEEWESPLANEILQHWETDGEPAKYWRSSTNFVFFFNRGDHVLRFNHVDERAVETIQAEIDHVNALIDKGIPAAKPVLSLAGNYVESVATEHGLFHASAFHTLAGQQLEIEELMPEQFARWGETLGDLHNASSYPAGWRPVRPSWEDHLAFVTDVLPPNEEAALRTAESLMNQLQALPINEQSFGLIHYDFELDNILWHEGQPGIIDFDDCAWYWFVADFALALGDLFDDSVGKVDLQNDSFRHFVEGYRRVRPMDDEELAWMPLFVQLDHLNTFAKLHRALTPINPNGELPWMPDLRDKLTAKMESYRDEFSD
ncbi:MAG: phosphotransferase [Chloroflexota bacterium]